MEKLTPEVVERLIALANTLTPEVVEKLLEGGIAEKPTKKSYMAKLAKKTSNYMKFIDDIELPESPMEGLFDVKQVDFFSYVILNHIKNCKYIPIFCSAIKNNKQYKVYDGTTWEEKEPDLNEVIDKIQKLLLFKGLKQWEINNPDFQRNQKKHDKWQDMMDNILFKTDKDNVSINKNRINNRIYKKIYNIHKGKY